MRRAQPAILAVIALSLLPTACSSGDDERPTFDHELAEFSIDQPPRLELGDGVEVVVGNVSSDEIVVQWSEDGEHWSTPETLIEGVGLVRDELHVERAGSAAVVGVSWYADDDDEREDHARLDAAVCHDFECDTLEDVAALPMHAADLSFAAARQEEDTRSFAVWLSDADGWREVEVTGPEPSGEAWSDDAMNVVLLADGRFATVTGRTVEEQCTFELWLSEPSEPEQDVVAATDPAPLGCAVEWLIADGDNVSFYNRFIDQTVTFQRSDGGWVDDLTEAPLLVIDPRRGIPMTMTDLGETGGAQATTAVGSPDGRRIVFQFRAKGAADWSRPVVVARAEPGQQCHSVNSEPGWRNEVVYVVDCWPKGAPWGDAYYDTQPPATGFALGSRDGRHWVTEPLVRPAYAVDSQGSGLMVFGGERSLLWRSRTSTFEAINLSLPNPIVDALLVTRDTVIRVTGNPYETKRCRATWSVAPVTATTWGPVHDMGPQSDWVTGPTECTAVVIDLDDLSGNAGPGVEFRVAAYVDNGDVVGGVLRRTAQGWRYVRETD